METRSSPSMQVLQGLVQQADLGLESLATLSKPALFGHLRAKYDYIRLERARQIALKRGDSSITTSPAGPTTRNGSDDILVPCNKHPCGSSCHRGVSQSPCLDDTATTSGAEAQHNLPPASIFIQTRSRSRLLAAACSSSSGGNSLPPISTTSNTSSSAGRPIVGTAGDLKELATTAAEGGGSDAMRLTRSRSRSSSPRPRPDSHLMLVRGACASAAESSVGCGSTRGSCSNGDTASSGAGAPGAGPRATADGGCIAVHAHGRDGSVAIEEVCLTARGRNTAKRKFVGSGSGSGVSSRRRIKSKGKGKAKAKTTSGRVEVGSSSKGKGEWRGPDDTRGDARSKKDAEGTSIDSGMGDGELVENGDGDDGRVNELDPIMLMKIGKDCHRFVRPNGRIVMYNLESLVDYFITTGDFLEPETRLPFSDEELRAIDIKVKAAGLSKPSVLDAKRDPARYTEKKFKQDALIGLERLTSELVTGMLKVVEESEREEGEIRLVTELFPPFVDMFKQIRAADKRFAAQCMQHYTSWLQGPPNRPTEDEMGFLEIILGFLKQLEECDGSSAMGF